MRRRNITWVWLLGAAFMVGCDKQVPEDIIQPDRMENILYDYHLSISMGNNLSYSDNYQKEAYKNYVFEKYHITEAFPHLFIKTGKFLRVTCVPHHGRIR